MTYLNKSFLKIVYKHRHRHIDIQQFRGESNTQFGFRETLGTRETLFPVQFLFQRYRDHGYGVFLKRQIQFCDVCLKHNEIAQHNKMIEISRKAGIGKKDLRLITNLYWQQAVSIKVNGNQAGNSVILYIFNLRSYDIFNMALGLRTLKF